jgi:hypothetical protein
MTSTFDLHLASRNTCWRGWLCCPLLVVLSFVVTSFPPLQAEEASRVFMTVFSRQDTGRKVAELTLDDIKQYQIDTHEIVLEASGIKKLKGFMTPDYKAQVCVRGEPVFEATFWSIILSAFNDGVVMLADSPGKLKLQLGYPTRKHYKGTGDPRSDPRLIEWLGQKVQKGK